LADVTSSKKPIFSIMKFDFTVFAHTAAWASLITLTFLEIVLGVDNVIFVSIVTQRLPAAHRRLGQNLGLLLAMLLRIILLFFLGWVLGLQSNLLPPSWGFTLSGKDIILILGGVFLLYKATSEIHHKLTGDPTEFHTDYSIGRGAYISILLQIAILNLVFSFDSILTAIGIADQLAVMMVAVIVSILIMMLFTQPLGRLIARYPTIQMLAFSFLIMIGVTLIMEGFGRVVDKAFIYVSLVFSLAVEILNIRFRKQKGL
jgi:predicted tellurium resistance membrane protein TerC